MAESTTLEHFGIIDGDSEGSDMKCIELKTFFEQNPNVQVLSTIFKIIWQNRNWILKSNVRIERLGIRYSSRSKVKFNDVCDLLNDLHEKKFYRRLHVYIVDDDRNVLRTINLWGVPERLGLPVFNNNLFPLNSPKELVVDHCEWFRNDFNVLANNMSNVQKIRIKRASICDILIFSRHCPKLKRIKVQYLARNESFSRRRINLSNLNNERKQLANAHKILIFIPEHLFLEEKWKQQINFSLIELKCYHSWMESNPFFE